MLTLAQLTRRGVPDVWVRRQLTAGRLHPVHPGVLSVLPSSLMTDEAWLAAAILAGGPGAVLCGQTAAWWLGLLRERPTRIEVAMTVKREPRSGIRWRRLTLAEGDRIHHRGMPVTVPARVPLDCA